jgi:hypothetical protein
MRIKISTDATSIQCGASRNIINPRDRADSWVLDSDVIRAEHR